MTAPQSRAFWVSMLGLDHPVATTGVQRSGVDWIMWTLRRSWTVLDVALSGDLALPGIRSLYEELGSRLQRKDTVDL